MIMSRVIVTALWVLAAALAPSVLPAHEASLGVLEFREVRPGAFVGRWTMEPAVGAAHVDLQVPKHCFLQMPQLPTQKYEAQRRSHRVHGVDAVAGHADLPIEIVSV